MSVDEETALKVMRESYRIFDLDKSGYIEPHEMSLLLKKLAKVFGT